MKPLVNNSAQPEAAEAAPVAASWADAPCAHVTRLVADILGVPIALLSLPRADEYRFRVNIGLDGFESVPCRISFCAYTLLGTDVMVVEDARNDPRFRMNPLVLGAPHIVAYVGIPLISARGTTLGTLCAIDNEPRTFTASQLDQLRTVAGIAAWLLDAEATQRSGGPEAESHLRKLAGDFDAERTQLAVALHEGVAQDLFALRLQLRGLGNSSAWRPEEDAGAAATAGEVTRALDRSIREVSELADELMLRGAVELRIADQIRQHAQDVAHQTGLEIEVTDNGDSAGIDAGSRLLVMRVLREALADVARQATACRVTVILDCTAQATKLRVMDDGAGGARGAAAQPERTGLAVARDRVMSLGGTLQVDRNARGGTTLSLHLPRAAAARR